MCQAKHRLGKVSLSRETNRPRSIIARFNLQDRMSLVANKSAREILRRNGVHVDDDLTKRQRERQSEGRYGFCREKTAARQTQQRRWWPQEQNRSLGPLLPPYPPPPPPPPLQPWRSQERQQQQSATTTVEAPSTVVVADCCCSGNSSRGGGHSISHCYSRDNSSADRADSSHKTDSKGSSTGGRSSSRSSTTTTNDNTRSNDRPYSEVVSGGLPARNLPSVRETSSAPPSPSRVGASRDTPLSHAAEALFRFRYTPRDQDTDTASDTHSEHTNNTAARVEQLTPDQGRARASSVNSQQSTNRRAVKRPRPPSSPGEEAENKCTVSHSTRIA